MESGLARDLRLNANEVERLGDRNMHRMKILDAFQKDISFHRKKFLLVIFYKIFHTGKLRLSTVDKGSKAQDRKTREIPGDDTLPGVDAAITAAEETFSKVLQLVRAVQSGVKNIDASHGLSSSQFWALWQISARPGLRVTELAEVQQIHPSTASNLLDKLESRGLIRRERRDADNRVVRLYLDEQGQALTKSIPGPMHGQLRHALRELPPPTLKGLLDGITNLLTLMRDTPR